MGVVSKHTQLEYTGKNAIMSCIIDKSPLAVFFVTVLMFGLNIWAAAMLMLVVCMIILHMFGCMHLLGINANAVSLVNLVMVSSSNETH